MNNLKFHKGVNELNSLRTHTLVWFSKVVVVAVVSVWCCSSSQEIIMLLQSSTLACQGTSSVL